MGSTSARFREVTGREPEGVWFAPGRANLIGEHTDHSEGFVAPFALELGVTVAVGRRDTHALRIWSRGFGHVEVASDDLQTTHGWARYVAGAAWALEGRIEAGGIDIVVASDLPIGAGLSSSAALLCASTLALSELSGLDGDRRDLALTAQRAENGFVGVPCGAMDPMASMCATDGHVLFLDCRSLHVEHVPFEPSEEEVSILIVNTLARHALVEGTYAERRRACEEAARVLGVRALRDADPAAIDVASDRLGPVGARRARHVVSENGRVRAALAALRRRDVAALGPLLTASHLSLRDDFEVSGPELDMAVDAALDAGAAGARMIGGGFGGCVLALVPARSEGPVEAGVREAFRRRGFEEPVIFEARPSAGARRLV